jgi:hypothetical protein
MKAFRLSLLAATVGAVLWCGWVLLQRHQARSEWKARRDRIADPGPSKEFNRLYGGSDLKILNFYAARDRQGAAGHWLLCYGVLNARSVRIQPPVGDIYPTLSKCVAVKPRKETRYTLTAEDAAGRSASASLVLRVTPDRGPEEEPKETSEPR